MNIQCPRQGDMARFWGLESTNAVTKGGVSCLYMKVGALEEKRKTVVVKARVLRLDFSMYSQLMVWGLGLKAQE